MNGSFWTKSGLESKQTPVSPVDSALHHSSPGKACPSLHTSGSPGQYSVCCCHGSTCPCLAQAQVSGGEGEGEWGTGPVLELSHPLWSGKLCLGLEFWRLRLV